MTPKITSPIRLIELFDDGACLTVDQIIERTSLERRSVRKAIGVHLRRQNLMNVASGRPARYIRTTSPQVGQELQAENGSIVAHAKSTQPNSVFDLARLRR
jgi:hypothetical protein